MKYTCAATALVSFALAAPALAQDACVRDCMDKHKTCRGAPGANMSTTCASDLANCLGSNPFVDGSLVTPTACSKTASATNTAATGSSTTSASGSSTKSASGSSTKSGGSITSAPSPTSGKPGQSRTPSGVAPTPVVTAAGDHVKPVMALLALGAAAIL